MKSPLKNTEGLAIGFQNTGGYTQQGQGYTSNMDFPVFGGQGGSSAGQSLGPQMMPVNIGGPVMADPIAGLGGASGGGGASAAAATGGGGGINMSAAQMGAVAGGIGGLIQGLVGRGKRRDAQRAAQTQYDDMLKQYQELDTSNLYADVENQYTNLENTYEDLTVNQQQAQFERRMFQQQQADTLQGLSAAAGGSGIAGLAQAMANQGQIAAQRAGASIGMQESRINMLRAQEASRLQMAERGGEVQAQSMRLAGAERARGLEYQKTGTELTIATNELAARNQAIANADAALYGGVGQLVGVGASLAMSDRKMKKNINLVGRSSSGLNIYNFEYVNSKYGEGVFQGVMADEVPYNAIVHGNNYNMVDYSMIDVEFKRIN